MIVEGEIMSNVIYEAEPDRGGVSPAFIIVCVMTIALIIYIIVKWRVMDIPARCFICFIATFLCFVIGCCIYTLIDSRDQVYDKYVAGDYLTVEGIIEDYTLAEEGEAQLPDRFYVDGVRFSVPGFVSGWGYPLKQVDGGVLENGKHVRIYYVPYKFENVIMKLEVLD